MSDRKIIFMTAIAIYIVWSALFITSVVLPAPIVYAVQPFSIDKDEYVTSDSMIISSYRCNNEGKPLVVQTVERYFFNVDTGYRYDMPSSPGVVQAGCSWQQAVVHNGFHPDMPSGEYVKRGVTRAKGRFSTVDVPWQTEHFKYIKE